MLQVTNHLTRFTFVTIFTDLKKHIYEIKSKRLRLQILKNVRSFFVEANPSEEGAIVEKELQSCL